MLMQVNIDFSKIYMTMQTKVDKLNRKRAVQLFPNDNISLVAANKDDSVVETIVNRRYGYTSNELYVQI